MSDGGAPGGSWPIRLAQVGGALHILAGASDLVTRALPPYFAPLLAPTGEPVAPEVSALLLALLRALGGTLVGAGVSILALIAVYRRTGRPGWAVLAIVVAALAEGWIGVQLVVLGLGVGALPIALALLVIAGLGMELRRARHRRTGQVEELL